MIGGTFQHGTVLLSLNLKRTWFLVSWFGMGLCNLLYSATMLQSPHFSPLTLSVTARNNKLKHSGRSLQFLLRGTHSGHQHLGFQHSLAVQYPTFRRQIKKLTKKCSCVSLSVARAYFPLWAWCYCTGFFYGNPEPFSSWDVQWCHRGLQRTEFWLHYRIPQWVRLQCSVISTSVMSQLQIFIISFLLCD